MHKYFKEISLSIDDFDQSYNIEWDISHQESQLRGQNQIK